MMTDFEQQLLDRLKVISSQLSFICVWLFVIMLTTCAG
jgi:hypothetical protein